MVSYGIRLGAIVFRQRPYKSSGSVCCSSGDIGEEEGGICATKVLAFDAWISMHNDHAIEARMTAGRAGVPKKATRLRWFLKRVANRWV